MSLFKKYGESLLDQPIGIEESRVRQDKEAEVKGSFQHGKAIQRVARRGYRDAMRNKEYGKAADMLDWAEKKGQTFSGIGVAGQDMNVARNNPGNNKLQGQNQGMQPSNLSQRIGLFGEMQAAAKSGGDVSQFRNRAAELGVDGKGWAIGSGKATAMTPKGISPTPINPLAGVPIIGSMLSSPSNPPAVTSETAVAPLGQVAAPAPNHNLFTSYSGGPNFTPLPSGISPVNPLTGFQMGYNSPPKATPAPIVDQYADAYNNYQSSFNSGTDEEHAAAKGKMQNLFDQASRPEKDQINAQSLLREGKPAYQHQEGSYKGSDATIFNRHDKASKNYQAGLGGGAPEGQSKTAAGAMDDVYNKANSVDQAKLIARTLKTQKAAEKKKPR